MGWRILALACWLAILALTAALIVPMVQLRTNAAAVLAMPAYRLLVAMWATFIAVAFVNALRARRD